jgi:hypothetical protein
MQDQIFTRPLEAAVTSVQRTRFQLRRPSVREGGVCCKPELGGSRKATGAVGGLANSGRGAHRRRGAC